MNNNNNNNSSSIKRYVCLNNSNNKKLIILIVIILFFLLLNKNIINKLSNYKVYSNEVDFKNSRSININQKVYLFQQMNTYYESKYQLINDIKHCIDIEGNNVSIIFKKVYKDQIVDLEFYYDLIQDFNKKTLPRSLPSHSIPRLLHAIEPPSLRYCSRFKQCLEKFNWTIGYESDSDIRVSHYDGLDDFKRNKPFEHIKENVFKNKVKGNPLASWFCSSCKANNFSNRMEYIKEMMKYIEIDSYGKCLNNMNKSSSRFSSDPYTEKKNIISKYKFYLSFERANCIDYITEKSIHVLNSWSVPIIMMHPNNLKYLPKNSYIYVGNFNSSKQLTDYLLYLDQNDNEYLKYFNWLNDSTIISNWHKEINFPFLPRTHDWVCPLLHHFQNWKNNNKTHPLNSSSKFKKVENICLTPNYFKIKENESDGFTNFQYWVS